MHGITNTVRYSINRVRDWRLPGLKNLTMKMCATIGSHSWHGVTYTIRQTEGFSRWRKGLLKIHRALVQWRIRSLDVIGSHEIQSRYTAVWLGCDRIIILWRVAGIAVYLGSIPSGVCGYWVFHTLTGPCGAIREDSSSRSPDNGDYQVMSCEMLHIQSSR